MTPEDLLNNASPFLSLLSNFQVKNPDYCQGRNITGFLKFMLYIIYAFLFTWRLSRVIRVAKQREKGNKRTLALRLFLLSLVSVASVVVLLNFFISGDENLVIFSCADDKRIWVIYLMLKSVVYLLQVFTMTTEFLKKVPYLWYLHGLFWTLNFLLTATQFALDLCFNFEDGKNVALLADGGEGITLLCLLILTLTKPHDILLVSASALNVQALNEPLIEESMDRDEQKISKSRNSGFHSSMQKSHSNRYSTSTMATRSRNYEDQRAAISVKMKKQVVTRVDEETQTSNIYLQFQVKIGDRITSKLEKNLRDFQLLDKNLNNYFRSNGYAGITADSSLQELLDPSPANRRAGTRDMNQVIIKGLQTYFDKLLSRSESICEILLSFLEVEEPIKSALLKNKGKEAFSIVNENYGDNKNKNEDEGGGDSESEFDLEAALRGTQKYPDSRYCLFFDVNIRKCRRAPGGDHYEFVIQLALKERPEECWEIVKRYSDFVRLRENLKKNLKINIYPLPKKNITYNETNLDKRRLGLEVFLKNVLNERVYFKDDLLFNFIELKKEYYDCFKDLDDSIDMSKFRAVFKSHEVLLENDTHPYTVYMFSIEEWDTEKNVMLSRRLITRRFREFQQLHEALQTRFEHSSSKQPLPALPPKYTNFGRTIVDERKKGLEQYLNALFKYSGISDSFAFRKFINFSLDRVFMSSFGQPSSSFVHHVAKLEDESSFKMDNMTLLGANLAPRESDPVESSS